MKLKNWLVAFGKRAFLTLLISMSLATITFIFTGNLTLISYSERLFWIGVIIILIGGISTFSLMGVRRSFGIPMIIKKPEHAKALLDHSVEISQEKDKRIDLSITIWLMGMLVIGMSAIIQIIADKLTDIG